MQKPFFRARLPGAWGLCAIVMILPIRSFYSPVAITCSARSLFVMITWLRPLWLSYRHHGIVKKKRPPEGNQMANVHHMDIYRWPSDGMPINVKLVRWPFVMAALMTLRSKCNWKAQICMYLRWPSRQHVTARPLAVYHLVASFSYANLKAHWHVQFVEWTIMAIGRHHHKLCVVCWV